MQNAFGNFIFVGQMLDAEIRENLPDTRAKIRRFRKWRLFSRFLMKVTTHYRNSAPVLLPQGQKIKGKGHKAISVHSLVANIHSYWRKFSQNVTLLTHLNILRLPFMRYVPVNTYGNHMVGRPHTQTCSTLEMSENVFFNAIPSHSQWFIPIPISNPRFCLVLFPLTSNSH